MQATGLKWSGQTASAAGVAAASGLDVPILSDGPGFAPQLLGTPAAKALKEWGTAHRYAGSGDRAGIAGLVWDVLRRRASSAWLMDEDTPRARVLGMASAAVPPRIMGIGPVPSTRKLMERLGLKITDFDLIELNEAFASQGIAVLRQLGVAEDADYVNPHGGAIALGHPPGMSGARLTLTAVHGLEKRRGKRAPATMCVGVGQGVSLALAKA